MKADLQSSVKGYPRNKSLKIQFVRVRFAANRQFAPFEYAKTLESIT
jgi:hypothetical protein